MSRSSETLDRLAEVPDADASGGRWTALVAKVRAMPILTQALQMLVTRGAGLAAAAAGSIWAARCLGPQRLGISGMVVSVVAPLGLLVDLSQDAGLVRRYKTCADDAARRDLLAGVFAFRWILCLCILILGAVACLLFGLPGPEWRVAVVAGFPLLLFTVNQGTWALQGQENMPARYRALLVQSLVGSGSYFLFFRPGAMAAGTDVIVMAFAVCGEFAVGWWYASRPVAPVREGVFLFSRSGLTGQLRSASRIYWDGRWLALGGVISYLYVFFQTPLIGTLLSTTAVGQYRTATTLVNGFQAFAVMVPALLYPRMIDWSRRGARYLWGRQWEIFRTALLLFIPGIMVAFWLAPYAYKNLYGAVFASAAYPFATLLAAKMLIVLNGIFAWGLWARGHDRLMLAITGGAALVSVGLNFWAIPVWGIEGAALVSVAAELMVLGGTLAASRALLSEEFASGAAAKGGKP